MVSMEKAGRLVARLTVDDRVKLRQCIDECLSAAIKFDETGKPEYFVINEEFYRRVHENIRAIRKGVKSFIKYLLFLQKLFVEKTSFYHKP